MVIDTGLIGMAAVGWVVLLATLWVALSIKRWRYPGGYVVFDFEVTEVTRALLSRGPSGDESGPAEREAEEAGSLWERVKLGWYTYPVRPSKTK